jgi:hypothetical protein
LFDRRRRVEDLAVGVGDDHSLLARELEAPGRRRVAQGAFGDDPLDLADQGGSERFVAQFAGWR